MGKPFFINRSPCHTECEALQKRVRDLERAADARAADLKDERRRVDRAEALLERERSEHALAQEQTTVHENEVARLESELGQALRDVTALSRQVCTCVFVCCVCCVGCVCCVVCCVCCVVCCVCCVCCVFSMCCVCRVFQLVVHNRLTVYNQARIAQ